MSDSSLEITVLTWPPLWLYWPAYLAMARAEKELPGLNFRLKLPSERAVTDVAIRRAFFTTVETNPHVMALCEPYELEIPHEVGRPSVMIRRLPVLSRQPLWMVGKTHFFVGPDSYLKRNSTDQNPDTREMEAQVWAYPEGTTSGNFARRMIGRLKNPGGFSRPIRERDLEAGLSKERAIAAGLGDNEFLATFTPWHSILKGSQLSGDMLFGPSSEITAVQFADLPIRFRGNVVQDILAAHLVGVLNELIDTQGVDEWLYRHVHSNWRSVQEFMSRSPGFAWLEALHESEVSIALREYTLLGCYFPYRAMNSAMTVEIQKRVLDVFDGARDRAAAEVSRTVSDLFGATPPWGELTFAARCLVWSGSDPIWSDISHKEAAGDHRDAAPLLSDRLAKTSATGPIHPLSGLARGLPMRCHYASEEAGTRIGCTKQENGSADGEGGGHCAACSLAGSPGAVARSAAESIARSLKVSVGYAAKLRGQPPCPLCFHDVVGLVDLFSSEGAGRLGSETPIEVRVYNEIDGNEPIDSQSDRHIVFAIWSRDPATKRPRRAGRTGPRLQAWAAAHTQAKRRVTWVGAWWGLGDGTFLARAAGNWRLLSDDIETFDDWEPANVVDGARSALDEARSDFEREGFSFGYVAAFLVGNDEHGHAMAAQEGVGV